MPEIISKENETLPVFEALDDQVCPCYEIIWISNFLVFMTLGVRTASCIIIALKT